MMISCRPVGEAITFEVISSIITNIVMTCDNYQINQ
jgi:hypothetical protein